MLTYAISVFNIMKTVNICFGGAAMFNIFGTILIKYLSSKGLLIELTFEIISFGILEKSKNSGLINFIIFLMKYFIFQCKVQNRIPHFELFINVLNSRIEIELHTALIHENSKRNMNY